MADPVNSSHVIAGTNGTEQQYNSLRDDAMTGWTAPHYLNSSNIPVAEAWAYASVSGILATITLPADVTGTNKYAIGDRVRLKQGGAYKYFVLTTVNATTLVMTGGTTYTLTNNPITDLYISKWANPLGYPDWFEWSPTWVGFSSSPTLTPRFKVIGRECTCFILTEGNTSNATSLTFTLPLTPAATPGAGNLNIPICAYDNGSRATTPGVLGILSADSVARVGLTHANANAGTYGGFTASGTKGLEAYFSYQI